MIKKTCIILVILTILTALAVPAFADADIWLPDIFYDSYSGTTDQFLVRITRPEGDESTVKRSYVVSGNTDQEGIEVQLLRVNDEGWLEPLYNTEYESNWEIGWSGIFNKEILLNDGANRIRVVAYKKDEIDNLVLGENLQINDFSVTLLNEKVTSLLFFRQAISNIFNIFK